MLRKTVSNMKTMSNSKFDIYIYNCPQLEATFFKSYFFNVWAKGEVVGGRREKIVREWL